MSEEKKWYVIYTWKNYEIKLQQRLNKRNIETYCPLGVDHFPGSERVRKVAHTPLFNSLLFVYITERQIASISGIRGVFNFIHVLTKPAWVLESDIASVKSFLSRYRNVSLREYPMNLVNRDRMMNGEKKLEPSLTIDTQHNLISCKLFSLGFLLETPVPDEVTRKAVATIDRAQALGRAQDARSNTSFEYSDTQDKTAVNL